MFYTIVSMKRLPTAVFLGFLLCISGLYAAEKQYATGKILTCQQKTRTRILYYQVDTAITKDDPYYEVAVQVEDTIYTGEHAPRHSADALPGEWLVPGTEVRLRLEKHYMFLTRPEGGELQFEITKRRAVAPAQNKSDPPSAKQ